MHNELFQMPPQPKIVLTVAEKLAIVHLIRFFLYGEEADHINGRRLRDISTALDKLERSDYATDI